MKSLERGFAIAVVAMFGFSTTLFAQVPQTGTEGDYPQEQQQQTIPADQQEQWNSQEDQSTFPQEDQSTFPQEQNQLGDSDYSEEVMENDLPEAISSSLDELYPEHEVKKAYRGTDSSYKVKLENGDEKSVVYFDSSGQFIKSEKDKDHKDKKNKDKDSDNSSDW